MRTGGFELGSSALTSSLKWLHRIECGFKRGADSLFSVKEGWGALFLAGVENTELPIHVHDVQHSYCITICFLLKMLFADRCPVLLDWVTCYSFPNRFPSSFPSCEAYFCERRWTESWNHLIWKQSNKNQPISSCFHCRHGWADGFRAIKKDHIKYIFPTA
jgi:hypothetical protein